MRLSCGGHMHAHVHVHACVFISFLFFRWKHCRMYASLICLSTFMSMHDSCQHTHARTAEITRTHLSCHGDECDADSLSLLRQSYIHTRILVCLCVYIYIFVCFAFLSIPDSCLANSVFLLDTGDFGCTTTSCRPWQPTFLPGFHRFSECVCFGVYKVLCLSESVECVCMCVRMSVHDWCLT
jgi:hypothetical protein